jgi:cytochrome c oxidase subunit 2
MRSTRTRRLLALVVLVMALGMSACGGGSDKPLDTFDPIGEDAKTVDNLVRPVFLTAGAVFVLVEGAVLYVLVKYRRRKRDEDADEQDEEWPIQSHGNVKLELGWTMVPAVILGAIGIGTVATIFELEERDADAMHVSVYGHQWWWSFEYDVDGDGEVDFTTANEMVIPTGRQIDLDIHSRDVIHSFWIPKLNGKRDAVPGRNHTLSLETNVPGRFRGQCTEFCGLSHARMQMWVDARSPEDYEAWVEGQLALAAEPETPEAEAGREVFRTYCQSCHLIRGGSVDADGNAVETLADFTGPEPTLKAGWAPELTHLMSRQRFAGAIYELRNEDGSLNTADLEAWIRDPASMKPADAEDGRGMPDRGLSEDEIDQVVAYLTTLE